MFELLINVANLRDDDPAVRAGISNRIVVTDCYKPLLNGTSAVTDHA
ncbi:hypothetical protein [Dyella nitratireducens]|nr:hypothetical protein [Dyella nitratireducens]